MSILINGVKMPKNCARCFVGDRTICRDECPIDEIPPHGRLIDADALLRDFPIRADHYDKEHGSEHFVYGVETVIMDYVGGMPTIIEAEE